MAHKQTSHARYTGLLVLPGLLHARQFETAMHALASTEYFMLEE